MTGNDARLPVMQARDWLTLLWLILLSPIWIPVALLGAMWWGLVSVLSWRRLRRLQLPDWIGALLVLTLGALMIPLYGPLVMTSAAFSQLLRKRIVLDDSAITIRGLFKTRRIPWHDIARIVEVFSPSNSFKLVFHNGEELAFGAFAEIQPVLGAAPGHGVPVVRLRKPALHASRDELEP